MTGSKTLTGTQTENSGQDCSSEDVESFHEDFGPTDSDQIHARPSVSSLYPRDSVISVFRLFRFRIVQIPLISNSLSFILIW